MICLECPVPAIERWSVSLLGAQSCQFVSSTQSWHVWLTCACHCKMVCVFAGYTVMSICKFYSIMTCLESPVPAIARWSVSLLGAQSLCKFYSIMKCLECPVPAIARWSVPLLGTQSCQFVTSTQSWHVLSALCLRLQAGLCLCWVHSHVNLQVLLNHDISWVPCACDCKLVCFFAGCKVMSICKFYSIMTCLSACLQLQAGLCLCWVHSHVNL